MIPRLSFRKKIDERPSDHFGHQKLVRYIRDPSRRNAFPISQNGKCVGNFADLFQKMTYVNYGDSRRLQLSYLLEQPLNVMTRQAAGRAQLGDATERVRSRRSNCEGVARPPGTACRQAAAGDCAA